MSAVYKVTSGVSYRLSVEPVHHCLTSNKDSPTMKPYAMPRPPPLSAPQTHQERAVEVLARRDGDSSVVEPQADGRKVRAHLCANATGRVRELSQAGTREPSL